MAFCSNCGKELAAEAKFCASCGTAVGGAANTTQTQTKSGQSKKCPSCGAPVESFQIKCSSCGYEFREADISSTIQTFLEQIEALDKERDEKLTKNESDNDSSIGSLLGLSGLKRSAMGFSPPITRIRSEKVRLISQFPIPNTKEDILEFLIFASSQIQKSGLFSLTGVDPIAVQEKGALNEAWTAKCQQAYSKALIAFGQDKEGLQKVEEILKNSKIAKKGKFGR
jgi:DNA-directed RNA polymerase subunit RPC12/RpoP